MKKRIVTTLLTSVMALNMLVGCGSNGGDSTNVADTTASSADAGTDAQGSIDLNALTLDEIIAGAKEEGSVSSVGMPDGWANWELLWQNLSDNYGISHDDVDMSSAEELAQFAVDNTKDIGDVGQAFGAQAISEDLVQGYKTSYWDSLYDYAKGEDGKWVIGYMGVTTFLVNEDMIADAPTSWEDVMNGDYKVSFGDISGGNCRAAITALALAVGDGKTLDDIDLDAAFDYLTKLAEAGRINTVDITQANFESGEVPMGVVWSFTGIPYANAITAYNMKAVVPSDGSIMSGYASVINKNATHPHAAALAREVILSDEGQTYLALAGAVSTRSDYQVPAEYADQVLQPEQYAGALVIEDTDKYTEICDEIATRWEEEIQPLLVQ